MPHESVHSAAPAAKQRQRDPLLLARVRRTDYALHVIRTNKVVMDAATLSMITNADGLLPLEVLGRMGGLSPAGTVLVGRKLLEAGYVTRVQEPTALATSDPLSPEMRALVRELRPILVRYAGEEAAFALEVDARQCNDLPGLIIAMRRRFIDANAREAFVSAVKRELPTDTAG
ncbi:MAG: hypothetical protein ING59_12075 [Burkholderiales bacterium]|nr:hypothetical protein [Burkholderiales bacterium]